MVIESLGFWLHVWDVCVTAKQEDLKVFVKAGDCNCQILWDCAPWVELPWGSSVCAFSLFAFWGGGSGLGGRSCSVWSIPWLCGVPDIYLKLLVANDYSFLFVLYLLFQIIIKTCGLLLFVSCNIFYQNTDLSFCGGILCPSCLSCDSKRNAIPVSFVLHEFQTKRLPSLNRLKFLFIYFMIVHENVYRVVEKEKNWCILAFCLFPNELLQSFRCEILAGNAWKQKH